VTVAGKAKVLSNRHVFGDGSIQEKAIVQGYIKLEKGQVIGGDGSKIYF
jgi:hypothetical protein